MTPPALSFVQDKIQLCFGVKRKRVHLRVKTAGAAAVLMVALNFWFR